MQVGEVAASAAGNQDLLPDPAGMVKQENAAAAPARMDGAEKACSAGAHNHNIVGRFGAGCLHSMGKCSFRY
jgi:hypothetical protein